MAVTSYGYPIPGGVIMPGSIWSETQVMLGRAYTVKTPDAAQPSIHPSAARTVSLKPGIIGGRGILDILSGVEDVSLPAESSGSRYHAIIADRVWGSTNATDITSVAGTSARALPSTLLRSPGTRDQGQVIGLARVTANQTSVTELVDLRAIAEEPGIYTIFDDMALQLLERVGVVVYNRNTGVTRRRVVDPETMTAVWQRVWDSPSGERPFAYIGRSTPLPGWGPGVARLNGGSVVAKGAGADSHFTLSGDRLVVKTGGVYAVHGQARVYDSSPYFAELYFGSRTQAPLGGLPGAAGSSDSSVSGAEAGPYGGTTALSVSDLRYLNPGATISLSLATNNVLDRVEAWQLWATRISD